jgi:hypothetical protein
LKSPEYSHLNNENCSFERDDPVYCAILKSGTSNTTKEVEEDSSVDKASIKSKNAFNLLMSNSIQASVSSSTSLRLSATYRLDLSHEKRLYTSFRFDDESPTTGSEDEKSADAEHSTEWGCNIRVRNFRNDMTSDCMKSELHLMLKSNIPQKTMANAAHHNSKQTTSDFPISVTVLKSMLQKAFRRRIGESVVRLAFELARIGILSY